MIKYFDISDLDITDDLITKSDKIASGLEFEILGSVITAEGDALKISSWADRVNLNEISSEEGLTRIEEFKIQCALAQAD